MHASVHTVSRPRWCELIASYPPTQSSEYRRKHTRRDVLLGAVQLAFELGGKPTLRSGALLNASPTGVLVKQRDRIPYGTTVLVKVLIASDTILLLGRAIHCTQTVGGYKLGIELQFPDEPDGPVR